jgi:hypothetical protein
VFTDFSHGTENTGVLIPRQQRILAVPCLRILDVRPTLHEILVAGDGRQFARDGPVYVLDDVEVGGEEDVEVALVDLICPR